MKCSKTKPTFNWTWDPIKRITGKIYLIPIVGAIIKHRFIKFGTIGFSGTLVNLTVLFINQEFLFRDIFPVERRLHLSLGGAIFVATFSNYLWNRQWTWSDRKGKTKYGFFIQMGQYFFASSIAISVQYIFTILLARLTHYLMANMVSIIIAAIFTYIVNDIWTFSARKE